MVFMQYIDEYSVTGYGIRLLTKLLLLEERCTVYVWEHLKAICSMNKEIPKVKCIKCRAQRWNVYRSRSPSFLTTPVGPLPVYHNDDTNRTRPTSLHFTPGAVSCPAETSLLFLSTVDLHLTVGLCMWYSPIHLGNPQTHTGFICMQTRTSA